MLTSTVLTKEKKVHLIWATTYTLKTNFKACYFNKWLFPP